jgi:RimJ/RimL family protein N-acetyltransferase
LNRLAAAPEIITAPRVALRPVRPDDAHISWVWRNDPNVRDYVMGYRLPVTLEAEQVWVSRAREPESGDRLVYGIESRSNGQLIGYTNFNDIDWFSDTAQFGILLGPAECRGRGIGGEVLSEMIKIAFESLRLYKLYVRVAAFNPAAQKMFADAGFVLEGVLKEHYELNDARHDVVLMALFRPDSVDDEQGALS